MTSVLHSDVADKSSSAIIPFRDEKTKKQRTDECKRVRTKYPDLIPVICERADNSDLPDTTRRKYLIPPTLTMGQFMYVLRRRISVDSNRAMFLFLDGDILAPTSELISVLYDKHQNEDGFMYMQYSGENTFG